jgi:hypothetical protein
VFNVRSFFFSVACLVAGCGGGDSESPVEKCDDLVDVICDRLIECVSDVGTHSECVDAVQSELPCGRATDVSASYGRCVDQLEGNSCGALFPPDPQTGEPTLQLPADCMSVILTERVGALAPPSTSPAYGPVGDAAAAMR